MNKMKKIGLTALAASLVSVSAQAADVSVSGGSGITFASGNDGVAGNPWSMTDNLTFSWGGELDNGMTVDMSFLLDNSDGNSIFDNRSLAIGMGDAGTLTFWGSSGSGVVGSFDDRTPNAYEESWAGGDSPNQGHSAGNMFYYTNALDAATIHASFTHGGSSDGSYDNSTEIGVVVNATDSLEVYGAVGTDKGGASATADVDNTIIGAKFTMGAATLGVQVNEADSSTANSDEEFAAWSISYAVSEDMSVSFAQSEINYEASTTASQEATGISASYTMGSMTLAGTMNSIDNQNLTGATGSGNQDANTDTFEVNLSFAF
jgi:outer membrane protein OmpU